MLQARLNANDPRWYNVNRDVAHNFAHAIRETARRLDEKCWPELVALLENQKVTDEDLGIACQALCQFVASAADNPKETMQQALDRSGWFASPFPAQVAVLAVLGTVLLGYYWIGVRDATVGGVGPTADMDDLRQAGRLCSRLLTESPWQRGWRRTWQALATFWTRRGADREPRNLASSGSDATGAAHDS